MSDATEATGGERRPPTLALAGWALVLVSLGYAGFLHHGLGPFPDGAIEWWSPREFLIQQSWIEVFEDRPFLGMFAFAAPAAAVAVAIFWLTRSAIARTLAVASVLCCMLFAYYGLSTRGPGIWNFFGWRGSAVMAGLALALAATLSAPLLARSWLRLPTAGRVAVYLPLLIGVVWMLRNVTGTDPTLRFAISPWPVIPLFGLNVGAIAILGVIAGMACAAWAMNGPGARRAVGLMVAIVLPAVWFKLWHGSFPLRGMMIMSGVTAAFVVAAAIGGRADALTLRSRHLAWGFALALLPLAAGEGWAGFDYSRTREGSARVVIDALAAYFEKHTEYPEHLTDLVDAGHLESIPSPKIGFGFLGEKQQFEYQSFGNGYNLEFSAPDWVQCAYNPSWSEDDYDDYDYEDEEEEEAVADPEEETTVGEETSLGEAWSCPQSPPELW